MLGTSFPVSGVTPSSFNYGPASLGLAGAGLAMQGLGGLLGQASDKKIFKMQRAFMREQMQNGIQWRVADAKAAGLHPLFALGAQVQSPSPIQAGSDALSDSLQNMGIGMGQLSNRFQMPYEKAMTTAQLRVLASEADKNSAMGAFYRSQAATGQNVGVTGQVPIADKFGNLPGQAGYLPPGSVNPTPSKMLSTRPGDESKVAARNPATADYTIDRGLDMPLFHSDEGAGEAMENTPLWALPGMILRNSRKYGQLRNEYVVDVLSSLLFGRAPRVNWKSMEHMDRFERIPSRFESTFSRIKNEAWREMKRKDAESRAFWREFQSDFGGDPWRWKKWFPNRQ